MYVLKTQIFPRGIVALLLLACPVLAETTHESGSTSELAPDIASESPAKGAAVPGSATQASKEAAEDGAQVDQEGSGRPDANPDAPTNAEPVASATAPHPQTQATAPAPPVPIASSPPAVDAPAMEGAADPSLVTAPPIEPEEQSQEKPSQRAGFTVVPQLGLVVGGWSRFEVDCDASGTVTCGDDQFEDYRDAAAIQVSLDGLYQPSSLWRIGVGVDWLPSVLANGAGELRSFGTELAAQGILEGVADVAEALSLTGRLEVGGSVLIKDGLLDELVEQSNQDCQDAAEAGLSCEVSAATRPALQLGVGVGGLWQLADTRIRLDLAYQMETVTVLKQEASNAGGRIDANLLMHQNRVLLKAGIELGGSSIPE